MLLEASNLTCAYGPVRAVLDVSFELEEGSVLCILGANGAGKSTTLKAVSGLVQPRRGHVVFAGQDVTRLPASKRVGLGITHCPEGRRIFARLSVMDNLRLGGHRLARAELGPAIDHAVGVFPALERLLDRQSGLLSGGEQQMLAIARAIISRPRLLLLDEPSLGLAPLATESVFASLTEINREGTTILLVEQNATMALGFAGTGLVLAAGRVEVQGRASELMASDRVRQAYLGG